IKRAYRGLARELHPDARPGDAASEERFKEVTVAYETLRDPERRRRYDMFGPEMAGAGAPPGGGFGDFGFGGGLGDIFETFFGGGSPFGGGRRGPAGPPRGADMEARIEVSFEEAVFGVRKELRLRAPVVCTACGGSGARPGTQPVRCGQCEGTGEVRRVRQSILGQMVTASPCNRCGGLGEEVRDPCADCRGDGRRTEEVDYPV